MHILTLLFLLYNQPGAQPNVPPSDPTVANPPADLFTRMGWADFTSGFWLGGCGGAVFAWFLCNTVHVQDLFKMLQASGASAEQLGSFLNSILFSSPPTIGECWRGSLLSVCHCV